MRVIGIDTSLRCTGLGVVESRGSKFTAVEYGIIKTPSPQPHSSCLCRLDKGLREMIERTKPDAASIEGIFFCKNIRTAVTLGQARGVVIAACAVAGIPVYEYSPRKMKQAIVGYGAAHKDQVGKMIMSMLALQEMPSEDAADALGLAICHLNAASRYAELGQQTL